MRIGPMAVVHAVYEDESSRADRSFSDRIAQVKKSGASARSSRANTPTGNPFAPQQQSMPSFQVPQQGGGDGGGFNFSVNAASNPFQNANGASATPPPSFGMNQQQPNGGGGMFGNNSSGFGTTFGSNTQSNTFNFGGGSNTNGNNTPSFGGFGQGTQDQGQQNGATPSSNTPSFGFGQPNGSTNPTFQFGQSQPQTQSTQATSFGSSAQPPQTNGDKPASNPFGGFGQTTQQKDQPAAPSFSFGQNAQPPAEKPATPSFGSFGQSNAQQQQAKNGDKPSLFGASQQAEQTPKPNTGSLFTFNSSNQGIGNKSTPEPAVKPTEAPKAPASTLFGAQQSIGSGLFGATPPPRESSSTPKPGESIFSAQNKPKLGGNLFTSAMAEGKKPEAPAPMFGQAAQSTEQSAPSIDQTPKQNNLFGALGQSQANNAQDTPKPSSNLFNTSNFGQTPAQPSTAPKSLFGQSSQDTSMHTPGTTPQKSSLFTPAVAKQPDAPAEQAAPNEAPAAGRSLFDTITRDSEQPATAHGESEQSSSEHPTTKPSVGFGGQEASSTPAQKSLFAPAASTSSQQASTTSNMFGRRSETEKPERVSKTSAFGGQGSTSQLAKPSRDDRAVSASPAAIPENERDTLKVLNEGLVKHLAQQDSREDWTAVMEYYLRQAASIRHKPAPDFAALSAPPATSKSNKSVESAKSASTPESRTTDTVRQGSAVSGGNDAAAPSESTPNNIFGPSPAATRKGQKLFQGTLPKDAQQTPKPPFMQPPSTAPVNRKRSAEDDAERTSAFEKRARASDSIEYPKLPGNASDVSKLFYNALENKSSGAVEKSPAPSAFKPPTAQPSASPGGFNPSTSGFKFTGPGFMPAMPSSGSDNFLAAFGKKASEQQEKDREKRKDEDYDSEEETEEQWAERDRKEQEDKRLKALESAKSASGFVFKATPATPNAAEKQDSKSKSPAKDTQQDEPSERPAESGQGSSLFDRISKPASTSSDKPSLFSAQTSASKPLSSNIFGSSSGAAKLPTGSSLFGHLSGSASDDAPKPTESTEQGENVEKQTQGTGDKSWNPNTPIKFGAAASKENVSTTPAAPPPSFGNLFGPKTQGASANGTGLLNVPGTKPAMGFNFGAQPTSANDSRATTPGVTTDGEGTGASTAGEGDNEPSDEPPPNEPQVEDMTGLSAEETKNESLLFSVAKSKASKWEEKKDDEGGMTKGWVDKGRGPLYLLKNDDTGKVRILLKVPPYGAAKMNFPPLKEGGYDVQGKTGKQIIGTFYDHLAEKPGLGKYLIAVGKKEDADEISRILKEAE